MNRLRWMCAALAAGAIVASCRDATQIRVRVESTLNCPGEGAPELGEASVLAGPAGKVEGPAQAVVTACETKGSPNYLGDIVIFPKADKDDGAEVWVIASTSATQSGAEGCLEAYERVLTTKDPSQFPETCIIAKRRIAFVPHEELRLSIRLDIDCAGKACDPDTSCYEGGQCRTNEVTCTGTDCSWQGMSSTGSMASGMGGAPATSTSVDASASATEASATDASAQSAMSASATDATTATTADASTTAASTDTTTVSIASTASSSGSGGACTDGDFMCTYASPMECGPTCATLCIDGYARVPCCNVSDCYCGACLNPNVCDAFCAPYGGAVACDASGCTCASLTPVVQCSGSID